MPHTISTADFSNILHLPKDKEVLDYIKQKLGEHCSPERFEVINELFEMHRTSTGFDPVGLSKVRFKRIKASAFRQILAEINEEIPSILHTPGYQECLQKQDHSAIIFEKLSEIKSKLEKNDIKNLEQEIHDLKEYMVSSKDHDFLVALSKLFKPYIKSKNHFG